MVGLIPEKTVEIWTACSLLKILGDSTWIWSPATGYDQEAWLDDGLLKWFVLELKAPKCGHGKIGQNAFHCCWDPYLIIDLPQLERYVMGYKGGLHPDVLYVLPVTPWCKITRDGAVLPHVAHPYNRLTFPMWSFVIPATRLHALLGSTSAKGTARVRCHQINNHVEVTYTGRSPRPPGEPVSSLKDFLLGVQGCNEPHRRALRSDRLEARAPRYELVDDREVMLEDLVLTEGSLREAMEALGESRSRNLLYVGTTEHG